MQLPNIVNTLKVESTGVTYRVMAYRRLNQEEMLTSIRFFYSQNKMSKPKSGETIEIPSMIR